MAYLNGGMGLTLPDWASQALQYVNEGETDLARIENDLRAAGFTDVSQSQLQAVLNQVPGGTNTMLIVGGLILLLLLMKGR